MNGEILIGRYSTSYLKFLVDPCNWGIGIQFEVYDPKFPGWEITVQVLCVQMWIGG